MQHASDDCAACEVLAPAASRPCVLLTCEHASPRLPAPWHAWKAADAWLSDTHWAYDIGARHLVLELAAVLGAGAVLSRFSRLLIDPNRPLSAPDLIRTEAEGRRIELNQALTASERQRRIQLYEAYHAAVSRTLEASPADVALAVHTFTPEYAGIRRHVEVGVLFDEEQVLAERTAEALEGAGFRVGLNEPYSGKLGLIFSVDLHARRLGRRALEIEVRQDLAVRPDQRSKIAETLQRVLCFSGDR